jgi:hypothetical protein
MAVPFALVSPAHQISLLSCYDCRLITDQSALSLHHRTLNPSTPEANRDYSQTAPLPSGGGGFPCKGYINNPSGSPLMDSVTTIQAGSTLSTKFAGTASHRGGSCQWSMSYDMGATWNGQFEETMERSSARPIADRVCMTSFSLLVYRRIVVHTQIGGCMTDAINIDVPIPSSAPSGEALFGWTWFNNAGKTISDADLSIFSFSSPDDPAGPVLVFKGRVRREENRNRGWSFGSIDQCR